MGKRQPFGKDGSVQAQDEVDDQLHPGATAGRAEMKPPVRPGRKDRRGSLDLYGLAADEHDRFAAADLLARAGDSGVDVADASQSKLLGQLHRVVGIARGRVNQQRSCRQAVPRLFDDRADDRRIGQAYHDRLARCCNLRCARGRGKSLRPRSVKVEGQQLAARREHPLGQGRAQKTNANEADGRMDMWRRSLRALQEHE